jgi:hypothetical protein
MRSPGWGRVALLLALLLGSGCRRAGSQAQPPPAPKLRFVPDHLDLGPGVQDQASRGTVTVRNDGTGVLEIAALDSSRFCSGRLDAPSLAPGGSARLVVTCRSDLWGPLREGIDVHSNDPARPTATLHIVGHITPLYAFDVPTVELDLSFGEERSREVHLVGTLAAQARPRLVGPAATDTEIVPLPAPAGSARGYRIRCLGRKVGANAGNLVVATGLSRPQEVAIPYTCKVKGTLEVSPANPFFNLKVSGDKAVRLMVKSSQPRFEVQSVRVLAGPFAARFEHAEDDNTYRVDVTVLGDRIADEARSAVGTLLIISNDRAEPRREVPLFGSGRINKVTVPMP